MNLMKRFAVNYRIKMLALVIIFIVLPIIVVGVIAYYKADSIISQNEYTEAQIKARQISDEIDDFLQDVLVFTEIGKREETISFLENEKKELGISNRVIELMDFYRDTYPSNRYIEQIRIFNLEGSTVSDDMGVYQLTYRPTSNLDYLQLINQQKKMMIRVSEESKASTVTITRVIMNESKAVGFIQLVVDATYIQQLINSIVFGETGGVLIETKDKESVFKSETVDVLPAIDWGLISSSKDGSYTDRFSNLVAYNTSEIAGWKIFGFAPEKELTKSSDEIKILSISIVLLTILAIIVLYYLLLNRYIRPLTGLKEKMEQVSSGDLTVKATNKGIDEITELGDSFNEMMTRINNMFQTSVKEQQQVKMAELRAMQAQINPHFLYNTLDTIIWMAEGKNNQQVIELTKALTHFFRISLSKGNDWITLEEEIEHIRNYLIIQKMRYKDILDVTFHLNKDILQYQILKLTLQPLVENAIYHGIKNKRGKGFVRIKGDFNSEGHICIDIIDNGIGMKQERLEEIRGQLAQTKPVHSKEKSFGMLNVHQRIQLYFGVNFGITVSSWYKSGTRVSLIIPAER